VDALKRTCKERKREVGRKKTVNGEGIRVYVWLSGM
jgi:hypothetical protein